MLHDAGFRLDEMDSRPPEFTDESLALRFSERHRDRLRYVVAWGRWLIWDGTVWRFDETLRAFDMARAVCREASEECDQKSTASTIASAKTVAAVERLTKADRRHAATTDQWEVDPWLLNTPAGLVDLKTGNIRPHHNERTRPKLLQSAQVANARYGTISYTG